MSLLGPTSSNNCQESQINTHYSTRKQHCYNITTDANSNYGGTASLLSSSNSVHNRSDQTLIIPPTPPDKNMEVALLLDSLHHVLDVKRSLGFNMDFFFKNDNSLPKRDTAQQSNVFSCDINDNIRQQLPESFTSPSSPSSPSLSSLDSKEQLDNSTNDTNSTYDTSSTSVAYQWHYDLEKAMQNNNTKLIISLLEKIPPPIEFNHIISNDFKNKPPIFITFFKLIKLFARTRIDLSFQIFQKSEEYYSYLQTQLVLMQDHHQHQQQQHQQQQQQLVSSQPTDGLHNEKKVMTDHSKAFKRLEKARRFTLIGICKSIKHAQSSRKREKISPTEFNELVQEVISIVHDDIDDRPILQHEVYPMLMYSLMAQTFSTNEGIEEIESLLWDMALSSLKDDTKRIGFSMDKNEVDDAYEEKEYFYDEDIEDETTAQTLGEYERSQWNTILSSYGRLLTESTYRAQQKLPFLNVLDILVSNGKCLVVVDILLIILSCTNS